MMPAASEYGGWPRSGEIDITEYRGQRPQQIMGTLHFGPSWDNKVLINQIPPFFTMD